MWSRGLIDNPIASGSIYILVAPSISVFYHLLLIDQYLKWNLVDRNSSEGFPMLEHASHTQSHICIVMEACVFMHTNTLIINI